MYTQFAHYCYIIMWKILPGIHMQIPFKMNLKFATEFDLGFPANKKVIYSF